MSSNVQYQYQPASMVVTQSVPVQHPRSSNFMRQGVKIGGLAMGVPYVIYMAVAGLMFIFVGSLMINLMDDDTSEELFDDTVNPLTTVGGILLTIGLMLVVGAIAFACFIRNKYRNFDGSIHSNPGRVINASPAQPVVYPNQPQMYPGQPAVYPNQPVPGLLPGQMTVPYMQGTQVPPQSTNVMPPPINQPAVPAGYPNAPLSYPNAAGYSGMPSGYPPTSPSALTDYPTKEDRPPPYAP